MSAQEAYERRLRAQFVRRASQDDTPLLASALQCYAKAEALTWAQLAQLLDCSVDDLNQVALCRSPRTDKFEEDVAAVAANFVDAARLQALLRGIHV